ncbi:MAG: isoprenylcysteine carboxylmethyltransferase family protein [Chloroflexi bacterium]|nr:isoprenylcysteine carboxylmethyltransferase family protein [Chloroflexota bacterium]
MSLRATLVTPRVVGMLILVLIVIPMLPLFITGKWGWWEAWAYVVVSIVGFVLSRWLAARRHPDLITERARFMEHADAKQWDRLLAPLVALGSVVILIVAGVDVRLGWSPAFDLPLRVAGLAVVITGYSLGSYALMENRFFSGMVRIQRERGHRVVSSGPYRWVRHPGYAGAIATYLAIPPLLSSLWAWLPAAALVAILVVRTRLEDAALRAELEGYASYAERVRYRLLPGLW